MLAAILFLFLFSFTSADYIPEEECLNYTVYPLQYDLTIIPYIYDDNSYYHCDLTITVIAHVQVMLIELDAKDLEIQRGTLKVLDGTRDIINTVRPYEYNVALGKLYIYLKEPLQVYSSSNGQFYHIKIAFNRYVKQDSVGLFLSKYYDEKEQIDRYLFTSRLSPNKAKFMFPCFDNPRFEAVFKFRVYILPERKGVQHTDTCLVISKELKRESTKDTYMIIEYMPSPQVALHQVGVHFSTFSQTKTISRTTNDTLAIWAPETELKHYDYILMFGERIINLIHDYEGGNLPLSLSPINIVAVPAKFDGYEIGSWSLLTIGAHKIANIEQLTSIKQIERMTFDLSQQLSRIWLGNPGEVQQTRWKEEWFKEGVATYFAYYFLAQSTFGSHDIRRPLGLYGLQMKHKAMAVDWHRSTPALETFNRSLAIEIPSRYKELVMMKTGALLWMLENWLESEKYHQAFVKYITARRGKYISLQDFVTFLDKDTVECSYQFFNGSTSSRILKSWFQQPGYPVIQVDVLRDRTPNAIRLKQRRFSFSLDNRDESDYLIPISYFIQHSANCYNCYRPRFTIGRQTYTFGENLDNGWIILNRNGSGYYRVNYDQTTWLLIANTLKTDLLSIDEMNRAQIVNDVFALYAAGDITMNLAISILDYLDQEHNPVVWDSVMSGFELLKTEGAACRITKHLYWEWEDFMKKKIGPIYDQLVNHIESQPSTRLYRSNIVQFASNLNYQPALDYLRFKFEESSRGISNLDPDIREACYYTVANYSVTGFGDKKLISIEQEDRISAEHRLRERNRFLIKIPHGEPRPMPIIMSTEIIPITDPVTEKITLQQTGGTTEHHLAIVVLCITTLINLTLR